LSAQLKYGRSIKGKPRRIYAQQIVSSKGRGDSPPSYTSDELADWMLDQDLYHVIHRSWVASGYDRWLAPSVDRIKSDIGYTMSNIKLTTWQENRDNWSNEMIKGETTKRIVSVIQMSLDGTFIDEHHSLSEAERVTGVSNGHICNVCKGKRKTAGGYTWRYK